MGIRIDALASTLLHSLQHTVAAMKDGLTVRLTVDQILSLLPQTDHAAKRDLSNATGPRGKTTPTFSGNVNTLLENGRWICSGGVAGNLPSAILYLVEASVDTTGDYATQYATGYTTDGSADSVKYKREYNASVWSAWYRVRENEEEILSLTMPHGECRLVVASTTSLRLDPYGGNKVTINGNPRLIPSTGVAIANTALTTSAVSFIYAYWTGSAIALEASATTYVKHTNGVMIKTGDASRTLVGVAYRFSDGLLYDDVTKRLCLSWFNRRDKEIFFAVSGSSAGALGVAIGTIGNFLLWNGEGVFFQLGGWANNNSIDYAYGSIFLNGARGHISGGYVAVAGVQVATGANQSMTGGVEALNSVQGGVGVNAAGTATISGHLRGIIGG